MAFTIHGVDKELEIRLNARAMGIDREADDYREFLGLWSAEEVARFDATQVENQRGDDEDWKRSTVC